ncbi:AAEL007911-PA, partial [Aedes aegypti]
RIFHNKRNEIAKNFKKFSNGIRRIKEATESVANLKIDLEKQQEKITVYQQELNEFINNIQAQTANADLQNQEVAEKRVKIGAEEIICKELAAIAETDLNKAMPALNSAIAALDSLNKKDMNEIKSYARPPVKVELVLNAVMILLGKEPTWTEAKRQLGEQKFLDTLKNYDKNNIPESTLKTIGGFVRNPELEPNKVGVVSRAAKSLMLWVRAIDNYGKVYKYVGPKIKRMEDATNSLREKQQSLREAEQRLTELAEQLTLLRKEYEIKMQSKFELEENAKAMAIKLKRSETLIDSLSEENSRWKNTAEELKSQYDQLIGNSVIVAASLVYFGCITPATRESLKSQWMVDLEALEISFTANCSTFSYFYSNETLQTWCSLGLPKDGLTVENATILLNCNLRSPLVVDPQGEIRRWLVQQDTKLISYNLDEERILSQVEEFAQSHQHIIAVNLREANINHFSQLQTYHKTYHSNKSGTKQYASALVVITTEEIPYHNKLKKTANVINFILDKSGLEVKLLVTIIKHENPSLEERKEALEQMIISSNETITNLEENILHILNHSQLPLIENEELYGTLQVSKQTASSVKENLKHAALTKTEIESSRDIYRSCATRASLLFFILEDLKHVNAAYRFKLEWYILLFIESLEKSGREQNIEERKKKIINHHTFNLFRYVRCALSLSDQTIFAFHLCVRVLLEEEVLTAREFLFFLNGAEKIDRHEQIENPNPDWIKPALWDNITELDKLPGFRGIAQSFDEINATWKTWCLSEFPEEETLPESWDRNLTLFQKYTLVRSVRLDRTVPCMKSFVATYQGKRFIDDNSSTLHDLLSISDPATPIILISDDENKPLEEVHNLHKIYNGKSNKTLQHVNMGTESFETTVKHLKNCVKSQNWLYLNQCWQSRQFLANFELIHQYLRTIDQKSGFRLWIVMHNRKTLFPVHVLHNCLKYRCSSPTGIKHNMKLIFEQIGDNFRKTEKSKHSLNYNKLIFALAFFHALLNERNKYLSLGWNMQYNFTIMDFKVYSCIIPSADGDDVLWSFVKNAVLQVGYGTNFTDSWDQRIFDAYCTNIFRRELIELSQCALVPDDDTPYQIPRNVNFMSYLNFIVSQFPQEDGNKVFGQNENANIIYLESCSAYALQKLRLVQLQGKISSHGQQFDVTNLDKLIMELLIVVPECLDYENVQRIVESKKTHVNLCLMQETYQYNLTLEIVRQSLEKTSEMLSGVITITSELLDFLQDLQRNRIPQAWISQLSLSYSTDKNVSDWIIELKHRVNHLRKWTETGQLSTDVTLGFFLNPKLFIHSVMRIHSDAYNIPLHDLTWEVSVSQTAKPVLRIPIENGFIGRGFYLYNGGWDIQDQCLVVPKILQLIHRMPPMMFKPTRKMNTENKTGFQCPCYYSSKKEKSSFIMEIDLNPGNNEKSTWIKMNTCMLLNES